MLGRHGKTSGKYTHLLKIRKLSSTCISCLLDTVHRICSYSSRSVSGYSVCSLWYENVGLVREDRLMAGTTRNKRGIHVTLCFVDRVLHIAKFT